MKIRDEMTAMAEYVEPTTTVREVAQKMRDRDIGVLPVCDKNEIVGIVTDRDITLRLTAEGRSPESTPVREIMTTKVEFCFEDEDIESAAQKMEKLQVRRIPVVDKANNLVGMLSLGDLATRGSLETACEILEKVAEVA